MKKLLTLVFVLAMATGTASAGPIDWMRENLFPVRIIETVIEKIVPVVVPAPAGWMIWGILIGVVLILLRGRKIPPAIKNRLPVFPKKDTVAVVKEETPAV